MRKIPCLFVRKFEGKRIVGITPEVAPGCEWVLLGEGSATVKWDGSACLVRDGKLFKRFDAKKGRTPPAGFEACGEPDPVTGHNPGWVPVGDGPEDGWHREARTAAGALDDGTYELIGPSVRSTKLAPYPEMTRHVLRRHGADPRDIRANDLLDVPRDFEAIRHFLRAFGHEGIVFHHRDGRMAKIRRDDFGFDWPVAQPIPGPTPAPRRGA